MVKSAVRTSAATAKKGAPKQKAKKTSPKPKNEEPDSPADDEDPGSNSKADSADEGDCDSAYEEGQESEHDKSDDGEADEDATADEKIPKKPKAAARKKVDKPAPKTAKSAGKNDGKKGKNKIEVAGAGSSTGKRSADNQEEKKPRKESALTVGWKKFSADYIREQRGSGKKLSQMMKEASEQCSSQFFFLVLNHPKHTKSRKPESP